MQIVIPMSGFGERFRRAGYTVPKPLIEVEGKPIIEHVVDLFPGAHSFLFICNEEHLASPGYRLRETLQRCRADARIVGIAPHKRGPVHTVLAALDAIDPHAATVVNYCDFTCCWDFSAFERHVVSTGADGTVVTYTGFHPHMLRSTSYAYARTDNGRVIDIQEKKPFTREPMSEHVSSGTYYFRSGALMARYLRKTSELGLSVGGEGYVSLVYKPLIADGFRVTYFDVPHFMQWGTPEDLAEYEYYSRMFRGLAVRRPRPTGGGDQTVMIPMAGAGSRFAAEGERRPKPLIPVSGEPMAIRALRDLPPAGRHVFVLRSDAPGLAELSTALRGAVADGRVATVDGLTEGQACTCLAGLDQADPDRPLTIGACDNGLLYDADAFDRLLRSPADVIVWGARRYPSAARHPEAYGWIDARDGRVRAVSVKKPLARPDTDAIVVGTFTFRRPELFRGAAERLFRRDGRVRGEFYVDELINDCVEWGLDVRLFEVDSYLCWGTPDDLRRYRYWEACFDRWPAHPFRKRAVGLDAVTP